MKKTVITLLREGQFAENYSFPTEFNINDHRFNAIGVTPVASKERKYDNMLTFLLNGQPVELLTVDDPLLFIRDLCVSQGTSEPLLMNQRNQ